MRREDLPKLAERLGQLAEAFDRKPPTPGALLVWLDVLKEFHIFEVESMLVDMPKRLTKFPAPAEVWKACNERRSDHIESQARILARELVQRVTQLPTRTPIARQALREIKAIASQKRPAKREWISRILQRHAEGDKSLSGYAITLAQQASRTLHMVEQDEELTA